MDDLEVAEVTFISIPGYAAHLEELGRIGPDGQWIPNGAVEHLAKEIERLRAELEIEKQCYKDVQTECDHWFKAHEEEQIEHDKTRAERDALEQECFGWRTKLQTSGYQRQLDDKQDRIAELEAERDALKKDAERYRYIRCGCSPDDMYRLVDLHCEQFDAVIDAVMEEAK